MKRIIRRLREFHVKSLSAESEITEPVLLSYTYLITYQQRVDARDVLHGDGGRLDAPFIIECHRHRELDRQLDLLGHPREGAEDARPPRELGEARSVAPEGLRVEDERPHQEVAAHDVGEEA